MRELRLCELKEQARRRTQLQSAGHGRLTTVPDTTLLARPYSISNLDAVLGFILFGCSVLACMTKESRPLPTGIACFPGYYTLTQCRMECFSNSALKACSEQRPACDFRLVSVAGGNAEIRGGDAGLPSRLSWHTGPLNALCSCIQYHGDMLLRRSLCWGSLGSRWMSIWLVWLMSTSARASYAARCCGVQRCRGCWGCSTRQVTCKAHTFILVFHCTGSCLCVA